MAALDARGHANAFYDGAGPADGFDVIVISKSFTPRAEAVLARAEAAGVPVVFDVCDNVVHQAEQNGEPDRAATMRQALVRARCITSPTPVLSELLAQQAPGVAQCVIPDMLEETQAELSGRLSVRERWHLWRLRRFLAQHEGALHCVWFGNSAKQAAGLVHVRERIGELETFARTMPVTLTIVSNTYLAYRRARKDFGVPTCYVPWSLGSFVPALRLHRVAIIPVGRNGFTVGKSINRPATALGAGLGVIADALPSYEELRGFIALDDWQAGLGRYARHWDEERARLDAGWEKLNATYGRDAIAAAWEGAFSLAMGGAAKPLLARNSPAG